MFAMIGGGIISACGVLLLGVSGLRVKGLYIAMATLAMPYIVDFVISHVPMISGGTQATIQVPAVRFLGIPVAGDLPTYYVALIICSIVTVFILNVGRTSLGRALAAVREKDYAAEIIGVNTFKFKLLAFWVSSFIGGVAGLVFVGLFFWGIFPGQIFIVLFFQIFAPVV